MQASGDIFIVLKYEDKPVPRLFDQNKKVAEILLIAKELFKIKDECCLQVRYKGKILEEEMLLRDMEITQDNNEMEIEIINFDMKKSKGTIKILIYDDKKKKLSNFETYFSDSISEVRQKFCSSQNENPIFYKVLIDGKQVDENTIIKDVQNLEKTIFTFEEIQTKNPSATDPSLQKEEQAINEPSVKKIYKFKYKEVIIRRSFFEDQRISSFLEELIKSFKIQIHSLKYQERELDFNKALADYMEVPQDSIIVSSQEDQINLVGYLVLFNEKDEELMIPPTQTVEELKIQACSRFKLEHSVLYSIWLDSNLLNHSQILKDVENFGPNSIFELLYKVSIKLTCQKESKLYEEDLTIEPEIYVSQLKTEILKKQIMKHPEFDLFSQGEIMKENQKLKEYILKNKHNVISIEEKKNVSLITFKFLKVPENIEYQFSASASSTVENLKAFLETQSQVSTANQVWFDQGTKIYNESGWLAKRKEKKTKEISVSFFAHIAPNPQLISVTKHIGSNLTLEKAQLDISENIKSLKIEIAKQWNLSQEARQIWTLESTELNDELPLAAQYNNVSKDSIQIVICTDKPVKLHLDKKEIPLKLNVNMSIKKIKEFLFNKKLISVKPEHQSWTLNKNSNEELEDQYSLTFYSPDANSYDIWIKERFEQNFFILIHNKPEFQKKLPLGMLIKNIKRNELEVNSNCVFSIDNQILEDNKCLKDYGLSGKFGLKIQIRFAILQICFQNKVEDYYFEDKATVSDVKQEVQQRLSIQDHDITFLDGQNYVNDKEIDSILKNCCKKQLTCVKLRNVCLHYLDNEDLKDNLKLNTGTNIKEITTIISKKLGNDTNVDVLFQNRILENDLITLEELDPISRELKFTIKAVNELEVKHENNKFLIPYLPSDTIDKIRDKLRSEGIINIEKFSLLINKKILKDNSYLKSYGIFYGKHILSVALKSVVIVQTINDKKEILCEEDQTVEDLKKEIFNIESIEAQRQILILVKKDKGKEKWIKKLKDEKLGELTSQNNQDASIILKTLKKLFIIQGKKTESFVFEGIAGAKIKEQKKLFEMEFGLKRKHQIWSLNQNNTHKVLDDEETLESYGIQSHNQDNPIHIFRQIQLTACSIEKSETFENVPTFETIADQKMKIYKKFSIRPEDQNWSYNDLELEDEKILEDYFVYNKANNENSYAIDLIVQNDLEYFGFSEKKDINNNLFKNFFIESEEALDKVIESVSFSSKEGSVNFRNQLLGFFFGTLKKHSLWDHLIAKIKKRTFQKKEVNLWKSTEKNKGNQSKFNTQFLLYYFLNSGNSELNVEILKIMKMHFPIPLALNTWTNRFSIENTRILNDLYWVFQKSFVIASFGFGEADKKVCGKTEFNNQILFSHFVLNNERNQICKGCPEIQFDIYKNDKFPVNLVDIPSETNEEIKKKIIENSNMLIIHSLSQGSEVPKKEIFEYLSQLTNKVPVIILNRDVQNAFSKIGSFKKKLESERSAFSQTRIFEIEVGDLTDEDRSNELALIASYVHKLVFESFTSDTELSKFLKFFENHNHSFQSLLNNISKNSCQLIKAISQFADVKNNNEGLVQRGNQVISLSSEINDLLKLLVELEHQYSSDKPKLLLEKLQEHLRIMKNQQTKDFYKLYEFKSSFSEMHKEQTKLIEDFLEYWKKIQNQSSYYQQFDLNKDRSQEGIKQSIRSCIEIFEQKIVPSIFSIELFWRELIYFTNLNPSHQIDINLNRENQDYRMKVSLYDFLVKLKKENILAGFPFEIIDGDLLHMPKEFLKSIFKNFSDRVIVISILGPQSSGKSTLLNFLFGCNFVTSSGRCTKGVYGTYFKVSNFNSCDAILILDTEGLFGLLNKNEEQKRSRFDNKLVLFCLAISDFVLLNFKGDIDRTLSEILAVCKEGLIKLQQGNHTIPEMFLILNQNAQTDINNQLQDINKMCDLGFSLNNAQVLPLAFETQEYTIEGFMDRVVVKKAKNEFTEECRDLAQKIFDKIKLNLDINNQGTLESIFDKMEYIWELMDRFPSLLKHSRREEQELEKDIIDWIDKKVDQGLQLTLSRKIEEFKYNPILPVNWESQFEELCIEEKKKIEIEFPSLFNDKLSENFLKDMQNIKKSHIIRVESTLRNELNSHAHKKKIKIYNVQGIEALRDVALHIKKNPQMDSENINNEFEQTWKNIVEGFAQDFNKSRESDNLFQTVKENYNLYLSHFKVDLPKPTFPMNLELDFKNYRALLFQSVDKYYTTPNAFDYTKQPPPLIYQQGMSDVSFKYFDLRKYFQIEEEELLVGISITNLEKLWDVDKIRNKLTEKLKFQESRNDPLKKLEDEISLFGIWIKPEFLLRTLIHRKSHFFIRLASKLISVRNPVKESEIDFTTCSFQKFKEVNFEEKKSVHFVNTAKTRKKFAEFERSKATHRAFFFYFLNECIEWDKIIWLLNSELRNRFVNSSIFDMVEEIKADLQKINLKLVNPQNILQKVFDIDSKEEHEFRLGLSKEVTQKSGALNKVIHSKEIHLQNFFYLNKKMLQESLQIISKNSSNYYIVGKWKGKKISVIKEFQNIPWLTSYAQENMNEIFRNTLQEKDLRKLVLKEFDLKLLLNDIFDACISKIKNEVNWKHKTLYQAITRETNDFIAHANNGLQQVSYCLGYELVANIHLSVVYLIWKYFEPKHWQKITAPLTDLKNRKEQQKEYFFALTSANETQINKAEAEKTLQNIESYFNKNILTKKKQILDMNSNNFKSQVKRKNIQGELDKKLLSGVDNEDDLYAYIIHPEKEILKAYENASVGYLQNVKDQIKEQIQPAQAELVELAERIKYIKNIIEPHGENFWSVHHIFEFKEFDSSKSTDKVLFDEYEKELGRVYHNIVFALIKGDKKVLSDEHVINDQTKVIIKTDVPFIALQLAKQNIINIIDPEVELIEASDTGRVTNAFIFIKCLYEQIVELNSKFSKLFGFADEDEKEFKDRINIFICSQKCLCCFRICGEEDPTHHYHQCVYGHQIRGFAGMMLDNKEASVIRCEDVNDFNRMKFNGKIMTWFEFKEIMKNKANNPWIFDDIIETRDIKEKFNIAWSKIGERLCKNDYGDSGIKYVHYDKAVLQTKGNNPKNYIFLIDSSGSMEGQKWKELCQSLKKTLQRAEEQNPNNKVTIINFSSRAIIEVEDREPGSINIEALTFQNSGTNFETAFTEGFETIKRIKTNDIVFLFMTDGEDRYPTTSLDLVKSYIKGSDFKSMNIKFDFHAIGFHCHSDILKQIATEMEGTSHFAEDEVSLTATYIEILNSKE